ncbi:MAG: cellulase family glycosylhydrolase [Proteobacteria bacterium]|nr:cellulase family glycosylhydrolase [Pseudomonadota bacterium]
MSVKFTGVNLAGLEFGGRVGGEPLTHYVANGADHYNFWADQGANTIRLPFTWERLQPVAGGALDPAYLELLHDAVATAEVNGQLLILDLHNYGEYYNELLSSGTPELTAAFADVWGRIAAEFKSAPNVWFGLMNEPHDIDPDLWMNTAQVATDAIRAADADNKILVSTVNWSSADAFNDAAYQQALDAYGRYSDPDGNFAFEVHQYLDEDSSGSGHAVEGKGATVLEGVTEWARAHGYELFVGEFGVHADGENAGEYVDFLNFMDANADVILGWTAWGAGEWWSTDYGYYLGAKESGGTDLIKGYFNPEDVDFGYDAAENTTGITRVIGSADGDILDGTAGVDVLYGGEGNDRLQGSAGSDAYIYSRGDGTDVIDDEAGFTDDTDVLRFTNIVEGDVSSARDGQHLVLTILSTGETITIDEQYRSDSEFWGLEKIIFADGKSWDRAKLDTIGSPYGAPFAAIIGTAGADTLDGTWGDDILRGAKGDDRLQGSAGSDLYIYAAGDGNDWLDDEAGFSDNTDVLRLTNLTFDDVAFSRDGVHLKITILPTGEVLTVDEQFYSEVDYWGIERIEFSDGFTMNRDDILDAVTFPRATANGTDGDETVDGTGGDDVLRGRLGDDRLQGGGGSDTYVYKLGDGNDYIDDESGRLDETDTLWLGGIHADDISAVRDGLNLVITVLSTGETITLDGQYFSNDGNWGIERIRFADGSEWNRQVLDAIGSPYGDPFSAIIGSNEGETLDGGWGDDMIRGAKGDDRLQGSGGSDTYLYRSGDGSDYIDDESGRGDETDILRLEDLNAIDIKLERDGLHVLLTDLKTGSVITIDEQFFSDTGYWGIEQIIFADGTAMDRDAILDAVTFPAVTTWSTTGNETVDGTSGDDVLRGGLGDDRLQGGAGSDLYLYASGDGNDYLDDEAGFTDNIDTLRFTNLNMEDISAARDGLHLLLTDLKTGQTITVDEQYYSNTEYWGLERIVFADGSEWDRSDLDAIGSPHGDPFAAIVGTPASETIDGTWGDDIIRGGLGDDRLQGSAGSDLYLYASGDGNDYLDDEAGFTDNTDILRFSDLNANDVSLARNGVHLEITIHATGEVVTVDEQFYSDVDYWGIERIEFADGTSMDRDAILQAVAEPSAARQVAMAPSLAGPLAVDEAQVQSFETTDAPAFDFAAFNGDFDADYTAPLEALTDSDTPVVEAHSADVLALADYLGLAHADTPADGLWFDPEPVGAVV